MGYNPPSELICFLNELILNHKKISGSQFARYTSPNAGLMLNRRLRRWPNIAPTLGLVYRAGLPSTLLGIHLRYNLNILRNNIKRETHQRDSPRDVWDNVV